MNRIIARLSLLEYFRAFTRRAPGGRDFLWMTMLMFFVQLLALVILTAREGVLERSVDAFLGNKPGYGIPVWTLPNILGEQQPVQITTKLLEEMDAAGVPVAPFRRLYNDQMIRMPGRKIWADGSQIDEIKFSGMAASLSGPMRPAFVGGTTEQAADSPYWPIVLDETSFAQFFDFELYKESLKGRVPQSELDAIPTKPEDLRQMKRIWLNVKIHQTERLTPFDVTWSKYFSIGASNSAYLVPIEMLNLFNVARANPSLCLFLEAGPNLGQRIKSIKSERMLGKSPEQKKALQSQFAALNAAVQPSELLDRGMRLNLSFGNQKAERQYEQNGICDGGISEFRLRLLAEDQGIEFSDDMIDAVIPPSKGVTVTESTVTAPCALLSDKTLERSKTSGAGNDCVATIPVATKATGYNEMLMFASDRLEIKRLVDFMNCRAASEKPAPEQRENLCINADAKGDTLESRLMINQIYEDSLNRFSFLTELLDAISGPIGLVMIGMLAAILWVQLGTVLGHRRVRYAMLLSNGLTWTQVKLVVIFQVTIGILISLVAAVAAMLIIRAVLLIGTAAISENYEKITLGRALDVLPLGLSGVVLVGTATLVVAIILTILQLRLNAISPKRALDQLLH